MNTIPLQLVQMPERETMGQLVKRRRLELDMSREDVAAKATELGGKVSESFVRDLEVDRFPSPGLKSVEYVARALKMSPLDLVEASLDEPTREIEPDSPLGKLRKIYSNTKSERLRALVDEVAQMLVDRLNKG